MDEFKSESEDELKPDTSDRPTTRSRKSSLSHGMPVSRQHMMMGIGIFVLLLFVIGVGSALTGSDEHGNGGSKSVTGTAADNSAQADGHDTKSIDLSGSDALTTQNNDPSLSAPSSPSALNIPPVSSTPTQAAPVAVPANQQRIEIPGDLNNTLSQSSGGGTESADSGLPTAQATVNSRLQGAISGSVHPTGNLKTTARLTHQTAAVPHAKPLAEHPTDAVTGSHKTKTAVSRSAEKTPSASLHTSSAAPAGNYTLQLSSASRADTLDAWAQKQKIGNYHVYQTTRNNQPWFVLVAGSYTTTADAKKAILSLPDAVRGKNPWVKPVSQVKKEAIK